MKGIRSCLLIIFIAAFINACALREVQDTGSASANQLFLSESIAESADTLEDDHTNTAAVVEPDPSQTESIHGIEIVEYVNPYRVSEYYDLTEDQQAAFSLLCEALNDIIKNGPVPNKSYSLPEGITWFDYKLALNLLKANYPVMENFISNIIYEDRIDEVSGIKYCEGFYLYGYDVEFLEHEYLRFCEISRKAYEILAALVHDGTEYGKAYSIAKWMVDHITYPDDYRERVEDYLSTAYTALTSNEAICGGYARTFDFLCKKAGLETIYLDGLDHVWNMIRIDEKWYHSDVTWMDSEDDILKYFMMTDSICDATGHKEWSYYWDQENNISISPIADSDDLYHLSDE